MLMCSTRLQHDMAQTLLTPLSNMVTNRLYAAPSPNCLQSDASLVGRDQFLGRAHRKVGGRNRLGEVLEALFNALALNERLLRRDSSPRL